MRYLLLLIIVICSGTVSTAQYAPQANVPGSTAISASSSLFAGWASGCTVNRGLMNIDTPAYGYVTAGIDSYATGSADHYIVSLGDSGVATLTFPSTLYNGPGADFAVFENGFANPANDSQAFLELAFVEVSSDGSRFVRFPAASLTSVNTQIPVAGVYMYANLINNLAGKYISNYGTPFDLEELADSPGLDVNHISHVRIVDVIGSVGAHACTDITGHIINDPYPTTLPTGGFDLDAVGAIHMNTNAGIARLTGDAQISIYPNPTTDHLSISVNAIATPLTATLTTITGQTLLRASLSRNTTDIPVSVLPAGMYYLVLRDANGGQWVEKVIRQ